jgi:tetratricopeptide (TPR) repeat protein
VFWIHASNVGRFEESLRDLADRAEIPGRQDSNANVFQLVGNWLRDEKIGKWILVLDNVDDDELLRKPFVTCTAAQADSQKNASMQPPLRHLLQSSNGSIIATSRSKGVALDITDYKSLIEVKPMEKTEALALLQNKLDPYSESEGIMELVEALEFMPLAIVQAASYITHRSPRCSVLQYLEKIQRSDRDAVRLLNYEASLLYRDWEAKNSILLTWQISFDYIRRERPSAAGLLSLMSFFDRQGIPESILRAQQEQQSKEGLYQDMTEDSSSEEDADCVSNSDADHHFEDDIITLFDYSFISMGEHITVLTMHRLVQLTIRVWLKTHGQFDHWKEIFISKLRYAFPISKYEDWETCRSLFPHVRSAHSHRPKSRESREKWATLLYRGALYASESGNTAEATEMALKSRDERLRLLGAGNEETLRSTELLAGVYQNGGLWGKAEQLQVQVMETYKTKLGGDHPDTLTSMANLAATYSYQGLWDEAENLEVRVVETRKAKLGWDHPETLAGMAKLAATYRTQGRWDEAEKLDLKMIEGYETKLSDVHPYTLIGMGNLLAAYWRKGRWDEAEQIQVQVMETSKTNFGDDHPHTVMALAHLAVIYRDQGRWDEAEQIQVQVMETFKTKLGEDHPYTLLSMANLAATYRTQGRWNEAESLEVQAMETRVIKLGGDHPDTLRSMSNLAASYRSQGRGEEAEQLEVKAMEGYKTRLGENHPNTLTSMANLAFTWKSSGKTADAINLLKVCLNK